MGSFDGDGVHDGVDGHAAKLLLFLERDAEFVECFEELGVDFVEAFWAGVGTWGGVVADGVEVDGGYVEVSPVGHFEGLPVMEGFESEVEHPVGLTFFSGDESDDVFVQSFGDDVGIDVADKAVFVFALSGVVDDLRLLGVGLLRLFHSRVVHCKIAIDKAKRCRAWISLCKITKKARLMKMCSRGLFAGFGECVPEVLGGVAADDFWGELHDYFCGSSLSDGRALCDVDAGFEGLPDVEQQGEDEEPLKEGEGGAAEAVDE